MAPAALQLRIVTAERVQGLPTALQQQAVDRALMPPGEIAQFGREGERNQEVLGRDAALELALQPLLAFVVLAVRTGAVAAGMRHEALFGTVLALHLHARAECAAAGAHRRQRPMMAGQEAVTVLRPQIGLEGLDDGGQTDHWTPPQRIEKPAISALIHSSAFSPVCAVRWV